MQILRIMGLLEQGFDIKKFGVSHTEAHDTGVRLFTVTHPDKEFASTITLVEENDQIDISNVEAWVGARTSRSQEDFNDLFRKLHTLLQTNPHFAAEKLREVFANYGHESVADMAHLAFYLHKVPIIDVFRIFYYMSVIDGQETSTRYIEFKDLGFESPEFYVRFDDPTIQAKFNTKWQNYLKLLQKLYYKWTEKTQSAYIAKFGDTAKDPKIKSTLQARTLDVARLFIPAGARTNQTIVINARNAIELSVRLRESDSKTSQYLGEQLLATLKLSEHPDARDIMMGSGYFAKYTAPSGIQRANLESLKTRISGIQNNSHIEQKVRVLNSRSSGLTNEDIVIQQHISLARPDLSIESIVAYVSHMSDTQRSEIGKTIFTNHGKTEKMYNPADVRGLTIHNRITLAYARDLGRHRAMGRWTNMFDSLDPSHIVNNGMVDNFQIMNTLGFEHLQSEWKQDCAHVTNELQEIVAIAHGGHVQDHEFIHKLIPLGHEITMNFSGPSSQWSYMLSLRTRPGGDIGYIDHTQQMLATLQQSDPFYNYITPQVETLQPNNFEQWKDRK